MKNCCHRLVIHLVLLASICALPVGAHPYVAGEFRGRVAWSADGNHNDPDDWVASPVALAILAETGLKDRLVHFDYNCILPETNPDWEKTHADSVLGAARHYGYDGSRFFDCRKDLKGALASLENAINASTADDPLYLIIAGPMEVPFRAIEKSSPSRRRFVYCVSHSRWNDGYDGKYKFTFNKRGVIEQDVHWVQIRDQNELLSFGHYGQPAAPREFAPYFWMRDSQDGNVRFLWERMIVSTRPDPSDAGMAWFIATGDERCTPDKLKDLLDRHQRPEPILARPHIRLEAENFRELGDFVVDGRKDKRASQQLAIVARAKHSSIRTRVDEPFMATSARYDVVIRYRDDVGQPGRLQLLVNGVVVGQPWASVSGGEWRSQRFSNIKLSIGDEIRLDAERESVRLDYVQLDAVDYPPANAAPGR